MTNSSGGDRVAPALHPSYAPDEAFDGVLILGAGVAGLFAALSLAPRPCLVLSPAPLGEEASSAWAQGGVAAALGPGDSPALHAADTLRVGGGVSDPEAAALVTQAGPGVVADLEALGAPFLREAGGGYRLSREAGHSAARVARFAEGDGAGRAIMATLIAAVSAAPSIRVIERALAEEILTEDGRAVGALCRCIADHAPFRVTARAVILAAGGMAGLYAVSTNPGRIRGQAIGMAARAGARLADAEFVQFHPTAIDAPLDPAPLATEALRGEGATLIDRHGRRFMPAVHPDAELAPRDVVARAVFRQRRSGEGAFLDAREALGARIDVEFPSVAAAARAAGVDPTREPIPVVPAAHYHMGGAATDLGARSSLPGLWVCGEAASTGLHGANRLASNGLLESLVLAKRAAEALRGAVDLPAPRALATPQPAPSGPAPAAPLARLRAVMSELVGVERDGAGLKAALAEIAALEREGLASPAVSRVFLNMTAAASVAAAGALLRQESRGGHFRSDFPERRAEFSRRLFLTFDEALALRAAAAS